MSTQTDRIGAGEWALGATLALAAARVHLPLIATSAGGCDEWHVLQIGANLLAGDVLYRDTNHVAGPGAFHAAAALFALFGERFEVGRFAMLGVYSFVVAATWLLTRRLTGPLPALAAGLWMIGYRLWSFPHFHIFHYATLGFALVTAAFVVLHAERKPRLGRVVLAGLLAGAAFTTKQDSGAFGALGCVLALAMTARLRRGTAPGSGSGLREVSVFVAAATLPALAWSAWFAAHGALGPFLWQTVWDPLVLNPLFTPGDGPQAGDYLDLPPLRPLLAQDAATRRFAFSWLPGLLLDLHLRDIFSSALWQRTNLIDLGLKVLYRLPWLILAIEATATVRTWARARSHPGDSELQRATAARVVQLMFAAAMWAAFSKPRDWIHFSVIVVPLVPIVARQVSAVLARLHGWPRRCGVALTAAGLAIWLAASAHLALGAASTYSAPVTGVRGTVFVRPEDARSFSTLLDRLQATPPDRPVLILPCLPVLTFLANRPPLTRFIWLWPRDAYADRDQQILTRLDERPDATIVQVLMHTPFTPRSQNLVPELFTRLAQTHRIGEVVGDQPDRMTCALGAPRTDGTPENALHLDTRLAAAAFETPPGSRLAPSADRPSDRPAAGTGSAGENSTVPTAVAVTNWALTPRVLHFLPGAADPRRLVIPIDIPPGGRLQLAAGVNPDHFQSIGPFPLRLGVMLRDAEGHEHTLLDIEKDVFSRPADRRWNEIDVDLTPFSGQQAELVLSLQAIGWQPGSDDLAGFEDPRITTGAPAAAGS